MRSLFLTCTLSWGLATVAVAQYAERPELAGSGLRGVDVSGRSIKNKRVRAVHENGQPAPGGTAWMFANDPYLAYQLGRNLNFREFRLRDGVFSESISLVTDMGGPMPDGSTARITAENQVSCAGCHNLPNGNPGGGVSFSKDSGLARNSPHYYGAGLVEMLGLQIRADLLAQLDTNGNGWISASEANSGPPSIQVQASPGGARVDFGDPRLDASGRPSLNNIIRLWFVDKDGKWVPGANHVDGFFTRGYNFEVVVWGWGQGENRSALNPTNRIFLWDPFSVHSGLEAEDPTSNLDVDGDGIAGPSLAGAIQFPATHRAPDIGVTKDPLGFSRDDPDGDGILCEITEGDLDLGEWFMLNAPRPAFRGTPEQYEAGLSAFMEVGCARCHVPDWSVRPRGPIHAGDRRLFDLDVTWNQMAGRLEGSLKTLASKTSGVHQRLFRGFLVEGLFSDLAHHDMGEGFQEIDFGGSINRIWRTAPLWGVGTSFPWGHDGQSLTLEDAILRHGGEAAASRQAYVNAGPGTQFRIQEFLSRLVLYDIESLPSDIDGDGVISDHFMVAGMDTGVERFNAEWLFSVPVKIQGPFVNSDGQTITSFAAQNRADAYGENLFLRRDKDSDGWPDVWDAAPDSPGYGDGVN